MDVQWIKDEPETSASHYEAQDVEFNNCESGTTAAVEFKPQHFMEYGTCKGPPFALNMVTDLLEIEEFNVRAIKEELEPEEYMEKEVHAQSSKALVIDHYSNPSGSDICFKILGYSHLFSSEKQFTGCGPIALVQCTRCSVSFKNSLDRIVLLLKHILISHPQSREHLFECIFENYEPLLNVMIQKINKLKDVTKTTHSGTDSGK